jgi:hypothetical protein
MTTTDPNYVPMPTPEETRAMWQKAVKIHESGEELSPLVRRLGRFRISERTVNLFPGVVALVMAECVIVRCELRYDCMSFEYVAVSPHFEVCGDCEPPDYEVCMVKVTGDGGSEARFEGFRKV